MKSKARAKPDSVDDSTQGKPATVQNSKTSQLPETEPAPGLSSKYYSSPRVNIVAAPARKVSTISHLATPLFIMTLCAAALYLFSGNTEQKSESKDILATNSTGETQRLASPQIITTTKTALDFTESFVEAELLAHQWSARALLSRITLNIEKRQVSGNIVVEYGKTIGPAVPGKYLQEQRLEMVVSRTELSKRELRETKKRRGLAQPNCPLEVAFYHQQKLSKDPDELFSVFYYFSEKYQRPLWQFKAASGVSYYLDGQSCAVLTRK